MGYEEIKSAKSNVTCRPKDCVRVAWKSKRMCLKS